VAQCRNWLPDPIGGILWFGVDDSYSSCYVPIYCGITEIPETFAVGNGDLLNYSETSAFWAFNFVANFAYLRYSDMIQDVRKVQHELEEKYITLTPYIDKAAKDLLASEGTEKARKFLTEYSVNESNNMTKRWKELGQYLLVKYIDGNIKKEEDGKFKLNEYGLPASPHFPGYPEWWYRAIVNSTGDHFKVIQPEQSN
jgi:dipeptidase